MDGSLTRRATVAIIGGSGLYQMLDGGETFEVGTPYGSPSGPITIAPVGDTTVAFLSRHGQRHELPPHGVNYRANAWALRELGVRRVLAPCAVGSLDASLGPGALVVPDQLVDWTTGRTQTFHDRFDNRIRGPLTHIHTAMHLVQSALLRFRPLATLMPTNPKSRCRYRGDTLRA